MKCYICKTEPITMGLVCSQECEDQLFYQGNLQPWIPREETGGTYE